MKLIRIFTTSIAIDTLKGQYHFLKNSGIDVLVISGGPQKNLNRIIKREGINHIYIDNLVREIHLAKDVKTLLKLVKIFKKEKPDIVHANTPKASLLSMVAAKICRVENRLYTVTGLRFETTKGIMRNILILMEKITCACATKVIPEGDGVAKVLKRENITKKPLKKIHNGNINGIDLNYFNPCLYDDKFKSSFKERYNISPHDTVLCFIGRLNIDKGIVELVSVFTKIICSKTNLKLFLIGEIEEGSNQLPMKIVDMIHNTENIIFTGWQDDVRPFLSISDLFIFPSHREGFPNVLLQAGAMKVPILTTNVNGAEEIIQEGINGSIIPINNKKILEIKLIELIERPSLLNNMSSNSREIIRTKFNQRDVWEQTLIMYNDLKKA